MPLHTSNEQAAFGVEVEQSLPAEALPVLYHVRLVKNEVLPLLALEHLRILQPQRERQGCMSIARIGPIDPAWL